MSIYSNKVSYMTGKWKWDFGRASRAIQWALRERHWCLRQLISVVYASYVLLIILGLKKRGLWRLQQEKLERDEISQPRRILLRDEWEVRETLGWREQPEEECKDKPEVVRFPDLDLAHVLDLLRPNEDSNSQWLWLDWNHENIRVHHNSKAKDP